jgi:hypothetical protein
MEATMNSEQQELHDRMKIMLHQEESIYRVNDYLDSQRPSSPDHIDELCRDKMVQWCFQVVDFAQFSRETVSIAMSYLDRFLCSRTPRALSSMRNRKEYQLAAMTTLYMAIKMFEPVEIEVSLLSTLSRGAYTAEEFIKMEMDILLSLQWRLNGPTALSFIENLLTLLPTSSTSSNARQIVSDLSRYQTEIAVGSFFFVTHKSSTVAVASIINSLNDTRSILSQHDRQRFLADVESFTDIKIQSDDIQMAVAHLKTLQKTSPTLLKARFIDCSSISCTNKESFSKGSRDSPICVSKTKSS